MRTCLYKKLHSIARRECRDAGLVEDIVQEAMLAAVIAGRTDFNAVETVRWLAGTVRNQARMAARAAIRRQRREKQWQYQAELPDKSEPGDTVAFMACLPKSLKSVAALTLSGHNRREVAYLLGLSDTALRQRIVALKRRAVAAGVSMPTDLPGLSIDIAYGRIRDALLPKLLRVGGTFASHDPDGHLFIVRRSQNADRRQ
ncbi:sigma factor [Devosia faecipullorum]|uniref:sigma factor n=1 Tax=Devosia faecipullorum TaxID=2755039 RepID=UPI002ED8C7D1